MSAYFLAHCDYLQHAGVWRSTWLRKETTKAATTGERPGSTPAPAPGQLSPDNTLTHCAHSHVARRVTLHILLN